MPLRRICLLFVLLAAGRAAAWETLTGNLDLDCSQEETVRITCSYRLLIPEPPLSITARYGDRTLSIDNRETYPWDGAVTAVILLVDTSDPGRQAVIERNSQQIRRILGHATPHHRIGLASFDSTLRIEAPVGSNAADINAAARSLKATGMTTELYRSTLEAVDILADIDADRKVIYLFSDGQAEDKAYFHQDVIRAARKQDVIVNSLGFQRSVALSVALQTLRRLSEETGGLYIQADDAGTLPASFLDRPFDNIDRGGRFSIDIESLSQAPPARNSIELTFATDLGDIDVDVPIRLPSTRVAATVAKPAPEETSPRVRIVTTPASRKADRIDQWLWYGVPLILLLLVLLTVVTLFLLLRKPAPGKPLQQGHQQEQFKPYAYLVSQDEKATRYPITRTTWRIGRSRDNELTLDDNSVSRRHAEIQRLGNGKFMIHDHDSLNGVFVNDEKVSRQKLEEGDIIEIGDFYLRFTEFPADYQQEEDTVLQKTRAPSFE